MTTTAAYATHVNSPTTNNAIATYTGAAALGAAVGGRAHALGWGMWPVFVTTLAITVLVTASRW